MENFAVPAPDYAIQESASDVTLKITVPLSRPSDVSVFLDKKTITFESDPYFLKLKLPCNVIQEIDHEEFDEKTRVYTLIFKKSFNDETETDSGSEDFILNGTSEQDNDTRNHSLRKTRNEQPKYGFLNMYSNMFGQYYSEFSQVIDLPDPDNIKAEERCNEKEKEENKKWDEDHYLADLMETEQLESSFGYVSAWLKKKAGDLNEEERNILGSIPKGDWSESVLSEEMRNSAERQMVDVLLGYCYNHRTTEGESTVESAWTINKLSSTLSWFEVFCDLTQVIRSFYKRSLIYPLYRNWELARLVHKDVVDLLKSGRGHVTRSFIQIKELFDDSENRHVLNILYINDLCHFSYSLEEERLYRLAEEVERIEIRKQDVHEDLIILEKAARMTLEEENAEKVVDDLVTAVTSLNVDETGNSSSTDSTSTDDSCSSSSSSSESSASAESNSTSTPST